MLQENPQLTLLLLLPFWHLPTLDNYSFSINLRNVPQNKKSTPLETLTDQGGERDRRRERESVYYITVLGPISESVSGQQQQSKSQSKSQTGKKN